MIQESESIKTKRLGLDWTNHSDYTARLQSRVIFYFDDRQFKRRISGKEMIVHCHHYNARLQGTIESATLINGKEIIRSSAETVFLEYFNNLFRAHDTLDFKWKLVEYLYSYLGYGTLDCSHAAEGYFTSPISHFVEGWTTGFEKRTHNVCTFTEGYLQGAYFAVTGTGVSVNEVHCRVHNSAHCRFEISFSKALPQWISKTNEQAVFRDKDTSSFLKSPNIEEETIITAMKTMPLYGNAKGLIPLFNVYLANIPADFYNLISIRFIEEMEKFQMGEAARKLLICCGEICALHTFRGVMNSTEWDGLVQPMIKETRDKLFALVVISNGLGWGNWQVRKFLENEFLEIESLNGYEALGYRLFRSQAQEPKCLMLTGVSAGIMGLLYSEGALDDKFGTFVSHEKSCMCCGHDSCRFEVSSVLPEY
jgi:hypothetical protein